MDGITIYAEIARLRTDDRLHEAERWRRARRVKGTRRPAHASEVS